MQSTLSQVLEIARKEIGWKSEITVEEGLRRYAE